MDGISVKNLLEKRSHLFSDHPVIAGKNGLDRLITNVNVMEVPDIYGQVRKGDLLLTTGYSIRDNILAQENLICGLAERNITAIGIKLKRYINILPKKMLEQAEEYQMPIIDLSNEINFSLVISEVLEEILYFKSKGIELAHQSSQHLTNLLIMGESLQTFMESVSNQLNRNIMLLTERGTRIGALDDIQWPSFDNQSYVPLEKHSDGRIHSYLQTINAKNYIWHPIGQGPQYIGYMVYEEKGAGLSTSQTMLLQHAAKLLVLKLANLQNVKHVEEKFRDIFLRKWILGELLNKEDILSQAATAGLSLQEKYVLMIASYGSEIVNKGQILRDITLLGNGMLIVPFDQQLILLIPEITFTQSSFSIPDLVKRLDQEKQNFVRLGIGSEKSIEYMYQSYKEAKESISVYSVIDPERIYCFYKELGIYTMLYRIANHEELLYPTLVILKPLFRADLKNKTELLDTLRCYVHQNGNIKVTAELLYCHYNSVLYRLDRIESLLGISVRAPEPFFHLQFAIRLHDFIKNSQPHVIDKLFSV